VRADAYRVKLFLAGLAALLLVPGANAEPAKLRAVRAPGFTVGVPTGWQTLKNVGSLKLMAVAALPEGGFRPNLNVVVTESPAGSIEGMRRELQRELPKTGIRLTSLATRPVRLPAGRALEVRYRGTMVGKKLTWLAFILEARGRSHVLTFTSAQRTATRHAPLFRRMARSFRLR
jgi:hypothetical protein